MSKIQTTIQRAIEKSRRNNHEVEARRGSRSADNGGVRESESAILKAVKPVLPNQEVMEENRIVSATDDRSAVSAYNLLRTRVSQRMRNEGWQSFLVTSPGPSEGKTLTAVNLAVSLSRDVNQTVILVDLDLQHSSVAKYFGVEAEISAGIGEFLTGNAEIGDIMYSAEAFDRIAIIPNRDPVSNSSDLLGGARMMELMSWLYREFSQAIVIFDMPPVLATDDVLAFCPQVDAVLLIVAEGQTELSSLDKTMEMLGEVNMLGVVMNKSADINGDMTYANY